MEAGAGKQNAVVVIVGRRYAGLAAVAGLVLLHPPSWRSQGHHLTPTALLLLDPPLDLTFLTSIAKVALGLLTESCGGKVCP